MICLWRQYTIVELHQSLKSSCFFLFQHSVSQEDIKRGTNVKGVNDVVFDIASVAKQHLDKVNIYSCKRNFFRFN